MIKFTDVCKAYLRYWYVILICIVLMFGVVLGVTSSDTTYTAKSTILVDKNSSVASNEFISQAYAESVIREMDMIIGHEDFTKMIIADVEEKDPDFGKTLTLQGVKANLSVGHKKDATFFTISFVNASKEKANLVTDVATKLAMKEYNQKEGTKAELKQVYNIEISENSSRTSVYAVIGILIGLVLGVVIVTFFVVFNPYVENKDLLEKETGVTVLATLEKTRGGKNED